MGPISYLVVAVLCLVQISWADITNRTSDDSLGDSVTHVPVNYLPASGVWNDEKCSFCSIQPDVSQTYSGTYTAATHNPGDPPMSITINFTGIAIWIFFTLANNIPGSVTKTSVNFTLDEGSPTPYNHDPDLSTTNFNYKVLVFQQENLNNTHHTLVISTSQFFPDPVYVNFDYAIYTHEDIVADTNTSTPTSSSTSSITSSSSSPSSTPSQSHSKDDVVKRAVIGGTLGGVGATLSVILALYMCRQWRRRSSRISNEKNMLEAPTPYVDLRPMSSHSDTFSARAPSTFPREKDSFNSLLKRETGSSPPTSPPGDFDIRDSMYTRGSGRNVFVPRHSRGSGSVDDDPQARRDPAHTARLLRQLQQEFIDLASELGESAQDMARHLVKQPGAMQDPAMRQFIDTSGMREQLLMIQARIEDIELGQSSDDALCVRPPEYSSDYTSSVTIR